MKTENSHWQWLDDFALRRKRFFLSSNLNHCYRNIFKICLCCLIYQVVLQTIECLADTRWELRRMGQQVSRYCGRYISKRNGGSHEVKKNSLTVIRPPLPHRLSNGVRQEQLNVITVVIRSMFWKYFPAASNISCVKQHCIYLERFNFGMIDWPFPFFQVLPLATEVVRWFDMKPLEILWDNYLSREHTLLCYGSCIALRYSILHAGRLMHFLEQPPPSWKVRLPLPRPQLPGR